MESAFGGKQFCAQHFDPKGYLEEFYTFSPDKMESKALTVFTLKNLHKAFILGSLSLLQVAQLPCSPAPHESGTLVQRGWLPSLVFTGRGHHPMPSESNGWESRRSLWQRLQFAGGLKGDTLIDIGSGPTIYQFLSACESFREIIPTDYADQNREEIQRWLRKEPGAFDWSSIAKYVCQLEGDREKWTQKEEKVRSRIKQVVKSDVSQPNPLAPLSLPPADCVLSTYCLEVACKDLPALRSALKNMGSLLKPGGHLILAITLELTFFMLGQHRFGCLYLEQKHVEEAVKEAGFAIEWLEATKISFPLPLTDIHGVVFVVARKH